jgi:hypothetical protein
MSTGNMPNPPDMPTSQVPPGDPQTQNAATATQPSAGAASAKPSNLAEDIAGILEREADILAQRLVYHSQTMYGVGAVGVDIVNAHNAVLVLANALRNHATDQAEYSLIGLAEPQLVQINDATLPFKNNAQIAGLFEGLVLDTISRAYADDADRVREARLLLESIFQPANERMQRITRMLFPGADLKALGPGTSSGE